MEKIQEIKYLEEQVKKLNDLDFSFIVWKADTVSLLKKIFPKTFPEKEKSINNISFSVLPGLTKAPIEQSRLLEGKVEATKFLNSYIQEIERFGVESEAQAIKVDTNQQEIVGRTFWDFLIKLIETWPIMVSASIALILLLITFFIAIGFITIEINQNGISVKKQIISVNPESQKPVSK